jgi:hypothetical protein
VQATTWDGPLHVSLIEADGGCQSCRDIESCFLIWQVERRRLLHDNLIQHLSSSGGYKSLILLATPRCVFGASPTVKT